MYWQYFSSSYRSLMTHNYLFIPQPFETLWYHIRLFPSSLPYGAISHLFSLSKLPPSLPPGYGASIPPGPRVYFLFVLAKGATCPGRPTAWSLPAVSTWHKLACWAGLQLRRPSAGAYIHRHVHAVEYTQHTLTPVLPSALYNYGPQGNVM